LSDDLIHAARILAFASPQKPRQAYLRRAVSTAYYAVFHTLARQCADRFIGTGQNRGDKAWAHVYRALDHGFAKSACKQARNLAFPVDIANFADAFVLMQEERHRADYDPDAKYTRAEALALISNAELASSAFKNAPLRDRRAFVAQVLLKRR
jgi:uncharacterized protein (UPF0332 family)